MGGWNKRKKNQWPKLNKDRILANQMESSVFVFFYFVLIY